MSNRRFVWPIRLHMKIDPMLNVLWLAALRIAAGHDVVIDLSTWPAAYKPSTSA